MDLLQAGSFQVFQQLACAQRAVKLPVRPGADRAVKRAGLAQRTLGLFTDQGFGAGKMGNAKDAGVKKAEIWADDPTDPAVQLVASRLPGVEINEGPALGPGVVVLVGDKFGGLAQGKPGIAVSSDASICVPRESPAPEAP